MASVQGDRLTFSATIVEAQRADRVCTTLNAIAELLPEVLPALRDTDLVDRLRAVASIPAASPVQAAQPEPSRTPPKPAPAPVPWQSAIDVLERIAESLPRQL
ncbi:hypothetical protein BH09ACT8_BH09ACT8_30900 [soil metagenome]